MAERKRPRRTRERILETALALFNRFGEPNITTADIADEMGISPGNLYYHFRSKDEIIAELFAAFERRLDDALAIPDRRPVSVEDLWLLLHLLFEAMLDHRFVFRDLDEILSRNRTLASRFALLMRRGTRSVIELCRGLVAAGAMRASEREIEALAENIALVATYWISYQQTRTGGQAGAVVSLDRAAYQVLALIAPFLRGDARALVERLGAEYL
ncbi:MAG TPA: TetR/AcrR family transcriptional regulator [Casimicrobiaceae bacterium]|nr:TetR/AcrR family transcriptional regulator [Casimicrobiaceae bacterium]